jgi:hypothetical protein
MISQSPTSKCYHIKNSGFIMGGKTFSPQHVINI